MFLHLALGKSKPENDPEFRYNRVKHPELLFFCFGPMPLRPSFILLCTPPKHNAELYQDCPIQNGISARPAAYCAAPTAADGGRGPPGGPRGGVSLHRSARVVRGRTQPNGAKSVHVPIQFIYPPSSHQVPCRPPPSHDVYWGGGKNKGNTMCWENIVFFLSPPSRF